MGGPAAFLDILAPPYNIRPPDWAEDQEERDCHYFRELTNTENLIRWVLFWEFAIIKSWTEIFYFTSNMDLAKNIILCFK